MRWDFSYSSNLSVYIHAHSRVPGRSGSLIRAKGCLEGAGHGVDRADWEVVVEVILEHT
jgi:hypothetical protein